MMGIKEGDKVKIEYEGKLDDGTVFDSSEKHGQALEFVIGAQQVIKGFEMGLVGMEKDEEKDIKIEPKDGYGDHNPELIKKVPKDQLPQEQEPKEGMVMIISTPDGQKFPAKIVEVGDADISLDLNHPLAGKTLNFHVKVLDFGQAPAKESADEEPKQEESGEDQEEKSEEEKPEEKTDNPDEQDKAEEKKDKPAEDQ